MSGNFTFMMIKPDAVASGKSGVILDKIISSGYSLKAMKLTFLSKKLAEDFYAIHKDRPFFDGLVEFMSSGPIVAAILEKENAVADFRILIGATNPEEAAEGTLRRLYATSIQKNAMHGSDSDVNADRESAFFFSEFEKV